MTAGKRGEQNRHAAMEGDFIKLRGVARDAVVKRDGPGHARVRAVATTADETREAPDRDGRGDRHGK